MDLVGVADTPTVSVTDVSGFEDNAIPLGIGATFGDRLDGSETHTITISGVPNGAQLSAGTNNGDGSWTLTPVQLTGLSITPAADSNADFSLTATATATEDDGDVATDSVTFNVAVTGVADTPTVTVTDVVAAPEDQAISLDITPQLADVDGSESITAISITGVPDGATLSAGTQILDGSGNPTGEWTLIPADLANLTLTPPADSNVDFSLGVTATSTENDGDTATSTVATLNVDLVGVADVPTVTVTDVVAAPEDQVISLDITPQLTDVDGSESISAITITGVPTGASLSLGTDSGGGTWTITDPADLANLANLTLTPTADSNVDFSLGVTATSTEDDGDTATSTVATLNVDLVGVADVPIVTLNNVTGNEDSAIPLNLGVQFPDTDGSETHTITISGVPTGAQLSAGTDNQDGTWTLTTAQLTNLAVTPAADSNVDFSLTVTATATEDDGDSATTVATFSVDVVGVADQPSVIVQDASGDEDTAIPLDIQVALADVDGSESITNITISGVPTGAVLSAGTDNQNGTWTLTTTQLSGLTITPPLDDDTDFVLTVSATSTENDGDAATTIATLAVDVQGGAEEPIITVVDAAGNEDTAIALDISIELPGGTPDAMYMLDGGSDSIVRVLPDGSISVVASADDIKAATGESDVDLDDRGIGVDAEGNLYFTDGDSGSILKAPADGGPIQVVVSESDIAAVTGDSDAEPMGLSVGPDGTVYINDGQSDSVVSFNPDTGSVQQVISEGALEAALGVSKVNLQSGIVTGDDGTVYVVSDDNPDAIFSIDPSTGTATVLASGTPFANLDVFITLTPDGDLIVADDEGGDTIWRVDTGDGSVSTFLSESELEATTGGEVKLEGGIGFDSQGNFYFADEQSDNVFVFDAVDPQTGTIDPASGTVFVSQTDIQTATGEAADLEG